MPHSRRRCRPWLPLVLVVMAGCGTAPEEAPPPGPTCDEHADTVGRIECYVERATREGHPRTCREADEDVRYPCYAVLAERLREASLCDDIPVSSERTRRLRDDCLSDVAAVLEQGTLCERILAADVRDGCFREVAMRTGDSAAE